MNTNKTFNAAKARNLGASLCQNQDTLLAFSDVDTFLSMQFLSRWASLVHQNQTFVVTRIQESRPVLPTRLAAEVNYGNFVVHADDFFAIGGFDETREVWGGEDDAVFHRLKLSGLREINPESAVAAGQYSLLHHDTMRNQKPEDYDQEAEFEKIYANRQIMSHKYDYLLNASLPTETQELYRKDST